MSVVMGNTIDNNGPFQRTSLRAGQSTARPVNPAEPAAPRAAGSTSSEGGQVSFSNSAAMLQRLHSQIEAQPTVDSSRVAAARHAIEDGSYQIDHHQIATKLLALDKELS